MRLRTLTVDVDGTVVSTGLQVERARRGYNPHHRKVPSYYPIMAHLAETTHVLRVRNRSGNVHDSKASVEFLRELWGQLASFGVPSSQIRFRMDGAFFQPDVLKWLAWRGVGYAIKVPFLVPCAGGRTAKNFQLDLFDPDDGLLRVLGHHEQPGLHAHESLALHGRTRGT